MKKNEIRVGAILSYAQMGLTMLIELLYTPILIRLLGRSEYGLYNTVASTIAMLSILSLGFNSSYVRFHAKYKLKNDADGISRLNGMFLTIFIVIGLTALACGIFLTNHLQLVFADGLSVDEYATAKILMILLTLNLSISFPMGVFSNIISANEKFIFLKIVGMLKTVGVPVITIPLLMLGYHSIGIVVATIIISLFADFLYLYYVFRKLRYRFKFDNFDRTLFKEMFIYTSFIAINMIVDQVNLSVDNVILGRFRGTSEVALYAVGFTLYKSYTKFSQAVSGVFVPRIHKIVNAFSGIELREQLTNLFTKVGRIQFIILSLVSSGLVFYGKAFIKIWAGNDFDAAYYVALFLIIPGTIPLIQNLGIEIQRAQNLHKFRAIAYLCMALINITLSWFLAQWQGAVGSTIGTAISFVVANGMIMNIYYYKRCNVNVLTFWKNILSLSKGLILPIIMGAIFTSLFHINSIWQLVVGIILYSFIYSFSMWMFGMNSYEKELVISFIHRRRTK